jgi:hypothetical protein
VQSCSLESEQEPGGAPVSLLTGNISNFPHLAYSSNLKTDTIMFTETLITIYQTTPCHITDNNL